MKIRVAHTLYPNHPDPPLPGAVKEDDVYVVEIRTLEELLALVTQFDLKLVKPKPEHRSRREIGRLGRAPDDAKPVLWLDDRGGGFRQR